MIAAALWASAAVPSKADEAPLFRLFLRDGGMVTCLGEYARLDTQVVCSLAIDGAETSELVTLRADAVDWVRTEDYTVALRAARYAEARGEHDFAELSGDVARLLNEVGQTTDNAQRLGMALEARRRLADWPARHHNYRASDVQQILQLVDDAISDFRAAAGAQQFDLALHAAITAPVPTPLLAVPTPEEALTGAVAVAQRAENAGERMTLLESIAATIARLGERLPVAVRDRLRALVGERLEEERQVDAAYAGWQPTWQGGRGRPRRAPMFVASSERWSASSKHDATSGAEAPRSGGGHPGHGAGRSGCGPASAACARPVGGEGRDVQVVPAIRAGAPG